MGIEYYKYVWKNYKKQGGHKLVMLALAEFINDSTGECWPSIATLAEMVCVSDRQISKVLRDLKQSGDIEVDEVHGRRHTNTYRIVRKGELQATFTEELKVNYSTEKVNYSTEKVNYSTGKGELQYTRSTIEPIVEPIEPTGNNAPVQMPSQSTGDPMLDAAKAKQERRQKQGGNYIQDWQVDLNKKVDAKLRVGMANKLANMFGLSAKMENDDKTLRTMHEQVVTLYQMGYTTTEKMEALYALWMADEWRKNNKDKLTVYKFTDFASQKNQEEKEAKEAKKPKIVRIINQYTGQVEDRHVNA